MNSSLKSTASLHSLLSFSQDKQIDALENLLRDKIDHMSGYSDNIGIKMKKLEQVFKFFDTTRSGSIGLGQFERAMVQLNFVGMSREIEVSR